MGISHSLYILGAGGHGVSVCNVALAAGFAVSAFVDQQRRGETCLGFPVIADIPKINEHANCGFAIAIGDNFRRQQASVELAAQAPQVRFPALIHPSAQVSPFAKISDGGVVMAGAHVGPQTIVGRFCLVNTHSSLDHNCRLADFASLGPGAITGGHVEIGARAAIGIGAVVRHNVFVGDDVIIGGNSYVDKDIKTACVAYGNPARIMRARQPGDTYLK